jgi:NitT/TauT family transport system substrate-binding protein
MPHIRHPSCLIAAAAAMLALMPNAFAEDSLKVAVTARGAWETAVPELGQQAGIFKKYGIVLDLSYAPVDDEIEQRVISGTADVGVGVGVVDVLRAYATKGAPLRIIGTDMTGSANYWYVAATSPINAVKDIGGRTIAYWKSGTSGQYDVFDFMDRYRVKARPVLTTGAPAAFDQVMAGKIDVGWAAPPFGIDAVEQGRIRVVAKANEIPKIRDKTSTAIITNADTLEKRKDVVGRFLQAYRETIDWMYSDPAAPKAYAEFADMSEGLARRLREEFFTKDMLSPDNVAGLNAAAKDAAKAKAIWAPLSRKQLAELVQIPETARGKTNAKSGGWFRALSPRAP